MSNPRKGIGRWSAYSKKDIRFIFPAMVDGEIVTQKSTHHPLKINHRILQISLLNCIFCTRSSEFLRPTLHLRIKSLKHFRSLDTLSNATQLRWGGGGQCERRRR